MKPSILFTLLATLFSSVSANSGTDVTDVLTSQAETALGSSSGFDVCYFYCYLDGGSSNDVQNCIRTRCGGSKANLKGTADMDGSFIGFDNDAGSIACQFHCIISSASNAEASDCMSTRCGGVGAESGDEASADASEVLISEVDTAPDPNIVKWQCYYSCLKSSFNIIIEDCILMKCGGDMATNSDKGNIDNSDVRFSEKESTA